MGIMATSYYNNHQIIVEKSIWTSRVTVKYDGRKVSDRLGVTEYGRQFFQVREGGQVVHYEVNIGFGWTRSRIRIVRNGTMIYSNEDGFIPPQTQQVQSSQKEIVKEVHIREVILVVCPDCNHRNDSSKHRCDNCGRSI